LHPSGAIRELNQNKKLFFILKNLGSDVALLVLRQRHIRLTIFLILFISLIFIFSKKKIL